MINLNQVLTFPFKQEKWISKLLVGTVVFLTSALIGFYATYAMQNENVNEPVVVIFIMLSIFVTVFLNMVNMGYGLKVFKSGIDKTGLPEWTDLGDIIKTGALVLAIVVIWTLPLLVLGLIASVVPVFLSIFLLLCSIGCGIFIVMLLPLAIGRFLEKGYFKAIFEIVPILEFWRANLLLYIKNLGLLILVLAAIVVLLSTSRFLTAIGVILSFYFTVFFLRGMGEVYALMQKKE